MNRLVVAAVALWCGTSVPAETLHAQVLAQGYITYPAYYPYGIYPTYPAYYPYGIYPAYPYWTYPPYPYSAYPRYWAYDPFWGPPPFWRPWGPPYWGPRFGVSAGFVFGGHRRFHHHDFDHDRGFHHGGHRR